VSNFESLVFQKMVLLLNMVNNHNNSLEPSLPAKSPSYDSTELFTCRGRFLC